MSTITSFQDLIVWQKAQVLAIDIYKEFGKARDYGFKNQIQRASVSIMNNIAEGYARRSDKALKNFLYISLGSAAEVQSMLLLAADLSLINKETQARLLSEVTDVIKLLHAFHKKLPANS